MTGKATQFGKHDSEDDGTGSEFLKVVQTNSDVFGVSLKRSRLVATFGSDLGNSAQLLSAAVEIFNPESRRFACVPIVDVGPAEHLSAEIDLTLALDQFKDLMQDEGDLAKMDALKEAGLAHAAFDNFVNGVIEIMITAALSAIP